VQTAIYALVDPRKPEECRYIGKTTLALNVRLNLHVNKSKRGHTHRCNWLRKLAREGVRPQIELLELVSGDGDTAEIQMIAFCRMLGVRITNTTGGGDRGSVGYRHTAEAREKMRGLKVGKSQSKEHKLNKAIAYEATGRARVRATLSGRTLSEEHKKRISEGLRRRANLRVNGA
jgi:hypothetical protein